MQHREDKKQNIETMRKMYINYTFSDRNGISISPFVGANMENENEYYVTNLEPRSTGTKTKEELVASLIRTETQNITQHNQQIQQSQELIQQRTSNNNETNRNNTESIPTQPRRNTQASNPHQEDRQTENTIDTRTEEEDNQETHKE